MTSFTIPLGVDLAAVSLGALQGALFAAKFHERRIDLLGIGLVGILTGLGGSLLRDGALNLVPAALASNWYLVVATAAALVGMLLQRLFARLNPLIVLLDALTVGLYAAIGTTKALGVGLPAVPSMFVGVAAAVGGSALRDVFLGVPIALMQVGSLYAIAATTGAVALVVVRACGSDAGAAALTCTVVTTVVRLAAVGFGWRLPQTAITSSRRRQKVVIDDRDEDHSSARLPKGTLPRPSADANDAPRGFC